MGWTYHQLATNHQTGNFELRYAVFKHIFVDLLFFFGCFREENIFCKSTVPPKEKMLQKGGTNFWRCHPCQLNHTSESNHFERNFLWFKSVIFPPAFDSRKKRSIPRTGVVTPKKTVPFWTPLHGVDFMAAALGSGVGDRGDGVWRRCLYG